MSARQLHFNAFIWPNGYHESAWRVVDDDVRGVLGLPYYAEIARIAERGLMDSIFLADNIAIPEYRVTHLPQTQFDPVVVLSALAARHQPYRPDRDRGPPPTAGRGTWPGASPPWTT